MTGSREQKNYPANKITFFFSLVNDYMKLLIETKGLVNQSLIFSKCRSLSIK